MTEEDEDPPLQILVLGTKDAGRSVIAHALVSFGHRAEQSWSLQHAMPLLVTHRFNALIAVLGPGQVPLRLLGSIASQLGHPRTTALIAIAPAFAQGQADDVARMGFDRLLLEPLPQPALNEAVIAEANPRRPIPALDRKLRRGLRTTAGEAALEALEAAVQEAAFRLVAEVDLDSAATVEAATSLALVCAQAGFAAAAVAARNLADEPERPFRRRALANALGAARGAARAERMRRAADGAI